MSGNEEILCDKCASRVYVNPYAEPRVHLTQGARKYNVGPAVVISYCPDCGALVADDKLHDDWHSRIEGLE